ncbi:uncharacterized protein BDCG_02196 [Blastomyces dermatitidis ER-3]|uniref:Aminoglycoside phosphotransferase domain-containing protein n=3 Tax=Blastomyces TaxID=229219 RepID=A0A179UIG7_BLAGS|nr:uncharacterized protein BDBG_03691 [Blastomyces gilchristii SLH14081]XP_045274483.1 uncharacterized protein BDCG_02196 [Blastomyces dermatitidis ER-3]EGE86117.1 hypothetical protein BDDG_09062 [Blastomyces dermatitidis ATCC 18188]EQL33204.1 hypothetical protein BDFG_04648 [Blastomyces dermatitidis ATCC 26199]EEQ87076.2 hypothetical protein BDCG_02196 [Blastomyces dermatitidis ER-3]OAT07650.1 hypothetical protein BDBG_03691 [Blastomyces gilchristii SLH14081]
MEKREGLTDILSGISRLRPGIQWSLPDSNPHRGGSHDVYKVLFQDSIQWAARVCHDPDDWESELRAMEKFTYFKRGCPEIKAPDIVFENRVLYSEWLPGKPLAIWNSQIALAQRHRLLDDLADFLLQLWTVPGPASMLPTSSSLPYSTWLTESLDRALRRTLSGMAKWGNAVDYLIIRSMIPSYAKWDTYMDLGFAHGDLNPYNIMIDEKFQLTGVIDWDWIHVAPIPAVIHHPWFIADIPGWNNDGVVLGESFEVDRAYLEHTLRKKEISQHSVSKVSDLLSDSTERLFFQSAFHFKGIHEKFVKLYCAHTEENFRAAKSQLDAVLTKYPAWTHLSEVNKVRDILG